MLLLQKGTQLLISTIKPLDVTLSLILAGLVMTLYLTLPVRAAAPIQATEPNRGTTPSSMSMAEMGAMMGDMMAQMNSMIATTGMTETMPISGALSGASMMSMAEMGHMMQMMGMMHQYMGQMQIMMGEMMASDMMGQGIGQEEATAEPTRAAPEASATLEPTVTVTAADSNETNARTDDSGHPTLTLAPIPQKATVGAVTVEASPLPTEELLDIAFAITLETHSVNLDFDLAERATLMMGEASFPATSWKPNTPGGHHVAGTLLFTIDHPAHASLAVVDDVTLALQDIDGKTVTLRFPMSKK